VKKVAPIFQKSVPPPPPPAPRTTADSTITGPRGGSLSEDGSKSMKETISELQHIEDLSGGAQRGGGLTSTVEGFDVMRTVPGANVINISLPPGTYPSYNNCLSG